MRKNHLISVWNVTFQDAVNVFHIKSRTRGFLQSHCITQDDRQRLAISSSFHRVGAEL